MGETPRLRTDVVDKVLLEAIAAGLKSNKKVIQTVKGPKAKKPAENLKIPNKLKGGIKEALQTKANPVEVKVRHRNERLVYVEPTSQYYDSMASQSTFRYAGGAGASLSKANTAQHSKERLAGPQYSEENVFTTLQHPIKKNRISQEYVRPHERAVKTITDATPWQDLYFNEEQGSNWGRSRTIAAKNLYQKYDTDQHREVPSVVYEDDTVDEQADSPCSPRKNKEGQVAAPEPMAETVKVSNDDNTEMAAVSGKIKSVE